MPDHIRPAEDWPRGVGRSHSTIRFDMTIMKGGHNGESKNCPPSSLQITSMHSFQGILDTNESQILRLEIDSKAKSSQRHTTL